MELLIFVVPMVLVWMLFIRPQQRKMRDQQDLVHRAGVGDIVVTAGGFVVTIMDDHDPDDDSNDLAADEVLVALSEGVEVVMMRRSIAQIRERWDGQYADGTYADDVIADEVIIVDEVDASDETPDTADPPADAADE